MFDPITVLAYLFLIAFLPERVCKTIVCDGDSNKNIEGNGNVIRTNKVKYVITRQGKIGNQTVQSWLMIRCANVLIGQ